MQKLKQKPYATADIKMVDQEIQILHAWLRDINAYAGWDESSWSLAALRAVLQELKNHLPLGVLAHPSAQLPIIVRGLFFEGWRPAETPKSTYEHYLFLEEIQKSLNHYPTYIDGKSAINAVFKTLAKHISRGETEKIRKILPESIEVWWLEST